MGGLKEREREKRESMREIASLQPTQKGTTFCLSLDTDVFNRESSLKVTNTHTLTHGCTLQTVREQS